MKCHFPRVHEVGRRVPNAMKVLITIHITKLLLKAILRDEKGKEKFYFSLFSSYIYVMTLVVTVL